MLKKMLIVMGCLLGTLSFQLAMAQEPTLNDTTSICKAWLLTLDQGQYGQSWETASSYFKSMVSKQQWTAQSSSIRTSLGDVVSRTFQDKKESTSLPGAPDGHYVVTTFATTFKNKASSQETVVLMKDKDSQWRIAGYFIK